MIRRKARREEGQSTIELVLTMFTFFTVFFMFVQVALSFAVANYIQYATFIASRAFLAGHRQESEQKDAARSYLEAMLGQGGQRFRAIAKPEGGGGDFEGATIGASSRVQLRNPQARDSAWEQGVTYTFKVKMYMAPMIPGVGRGDASKVTLTSESWLGREPTERDCEDGMARRASQQQVRSVMIYDNGC